MDLETFCLLQVARCRAQQPTVGGKRAFYDFKKTVGPLYLADEYVTPESHQRWLADLSHERKEARRGLTKTGFGTILFGRSRRGKVVGDGQYIRIGRKPAAVFEEMEEEEND